MARKQLQNLTEPMFYVLLCLNEPIHGYGIMQEVERISNGRVRVGPGTLYNLIARFEKELIVEPVRQEGNKKYYRLTDKGRLLIEEEYERLQQLVIDGAAIMNKGKEKKNQR